MLSADQAARRIRDVGAWKVLHDIGDEAEEEAGSLYGCARLRDVVVVDEEGEVLSWLALVGLYSGDAGLFYV